MISLAIIYPFCVESKYAKVGLAWLMVYTTESLFVYETAVRLLTLPFKAVKVLLSSSNLPSEI